MAPADSEAICLFAQFLVKSFKAPQSILNYVASVKLWHTLLDLDTSLFNSIEFKLTKKGLLRSMQHIIRQAAPMTSRFLDGSDRSLSSAIPLMPHIGHYFWSPSSQWLGNPFGFRIQPPVSILKSSCWDRKFWLGTAVCWCFGPWPKTYKTGTKRIRSPCCRSQDPQCAQLQLIRTCAILFLWKNTRLPSQLFPVPAQSQLHIRSSLVNSNNWSKHAASTQMMTQCTVFSEVGPHALSEQKYPIHWFSCKGTGRRTATKDI